MIRLANLSSKLPVALLVVALAMLPIISALAGRSASPNGLKLTQRSKTYGTQDVYISPLGIKVINEKMGRGMICGPPDWKVINWCTRTNSYAIEDYKKWKPYLSMSDQVFSGFDIREVPFEKPTVGKVANQPTRHYKSPQAFAQEMLYRHAHRTSPGAAPQVVHFDLMEAPSMPAQIGALMERSYQTPEVTGVPLRVSYLNCNNENTIELDTISLTPIELTKSDYVFPKNFKKMQTDAEIYRPPSNQDLKDLMGM